MHAKKSTEKSSISSTDIVKIYSATVSFITIVMIINSALNLSGFTDKLFPGIILRMAVCWLFFSCMVILFFKPEFWQLFSISHVCMGFFTMIAGESPLGSILFLLGIVMAIQNHFFKKKATLKILFVSFLLAIALALAQIIDGSVMKKHTFCELMLSCSCFFISLHLLVILTNYPDSARASVRTGDSGQNGGGKKLYLSDYNFTYNELYALSAIMRDEPYYAISLYLAVSESVVKKMMLGIYSRFGCKNRELFIDKISGYDLVYPEWFKLP